MTVVLVLRRSRIAHPGDRTPEQCPTWSGHGPIAETRACPKDGDENGAAPVLDAVRSGPSVPDLVTVDDEQCERRKTVGSDQLRLRQRA